MRFHHLGCALLLTLPLAACKGRDSAPATHANPATSSASAAPAARTFPAKSGIVEWKANLLGETNVVAYIDDYGARRATYTTMKLTILDNTTVKHIVEIEEGGWVTKFNPDSGTGERRRGSGSGMAAMASAMKPSDVAQLTAEDRARYKFQELPARTILGKEAKGYAMEMMRMKMRGWSWENIPMRMEADMGGKEPMVMEAIRLELDVPVPADKFAVPANVVITEASR